MQVCIDADIYLLFLICDLAGCVLYILRFRRFCLKINKISWHCDYIVAVFQGPPKLHFPPHYKLNKTLLSEDSRNKL